MGDMDGNGLVNIADFSTMVGTFPACDDRSGLPRCGRSSTATSRSAIGDISQLAANFLHSVPTPFAELTRPP